MNHWPFLPPSTSNTILPPRPWTWQFHVCKHWERGWQADFARLGRFTSCASWGSWAWLPWGGMFAFFVCCLFAFLSMTTLRKHHHDQPWPQVFLAVLLQPEDLPTLGPRQTRLSPVVLAGPPRLAFRWHKFPNFHKLIEFNRKPVVLGFGHCASLQQDGWEIGVSQFILFWICPLEHWNSSVLWICPILVVTWNVCVNECLHFFWIYPLETFGVIWDIFIRGTFQTALWRFPLQLIIQLLDEDITWKFITMKPSGLPILGMKEIHAS